MCYKVLLLCTGEGGRGKGDGARIPCQDWECNALFPGRIAMRLPFPLPCLLLSLSALQGCISSVKSHLMGQCITRVEGILSAGGYGAESPLVTAGCAWAWAWHVSASSELHRRE